MSYDDQLVAGKLRRWEKYLNEYRLPRWEDIPDLGLYMEQVLVLMREYLDYLPPELKEEQFLTAATINNYVRNRIMPMPRRKRYYRIHIAYLIMICTLKQSLSIATLQTMIPMDIPIDEVRRIYDAYAQRHRVTAAYFAQQIRLVAGPILGHADTGDELAVHQTSDLIASAAIAAGLSRLLAEKLLLLDGKTLDDDLPIG